MNTKRNSGAANFALASNGSLVYVAGTASGPRRTLVWVDREGREELLRLPAVTYGWARVSPDGSRVAVSVTDSEGDQDVWISELARRTLSRVTTDPETDNDPVWTRDGRRIVFASRRQAGRFGFYRRPPMVPARPICCS